MTDIETLSRALKRAHQAGDTNAARRFASEIKRMRSAPENYTGQQHPEFDPANVPGGVKGYNPETGMVERQHSMAGSAALGAADTASFGFADELGSYVGSAMTGRPRERVLAQMRRVQTGAQEQNPGSYLAGQIGGSIAQGVAAGPGILANAGSLGGRVAGGMATGAFMGGAYGAGSGTDAETRVSEALKGTAIGGAAGAAFPLVATGAGKAFEAGRNYLRAGPIARRAGSSPEALRMLGDVIDADGSLGVAGQANMARAGQEAMLVDAGPNARMVLDTAIQKGGRGTVIAQNAVRGRTARAAKELGDILDATLGTRQGVYASQNNIRAATKGSVTQGYTRAYATPIDYSTPNGRAVEDIINRIPGRIARRAIDSASEQMAYDGLPRMQGLISVAPDGSVTFKQLPNVMQADYIKRALNAIVEDGTDPLTGKLSSDAAFASRMARDLRDALADAVPAYKLALQTAADPLSQQSAIRLGARVLSSSMTRDQVDQAVKGITKPEREALAQGLRSHIDDVMAKITRTVQDGDTNAREAIKALKELSSRANREKVTAAIGKGPADTLFDKLDSIATTFDLRASVAENSKTFGRTATEKRVGAIASPDGFVSAAKRGEGINAYKRLVQSFTGATPEAAMKNEQAVYSELADLLTRQGGAGQGVYDAISDLGQTDAATRLMRDRILGALSGPRLAYPSTTLETNRTR